MFRIKGTFKQNFRFTILILICMASSTCLASTSTDLDSLLQNIYNSSPVYKDTIEEYRAQLYVRAFLDIKKKNIIFRHIPHLLKTEKNVNQYLLETFSDIHYTYPNIYDQKIRNISSTLRNQNNIPGISEYLHANIYAPYMVNNKLLSPLVATSNRHYYYRLDSICITASGKVLYHISFEPKYKNQQLVSGHCIVDAKNWVVRDFYFEGQSDLLHFKCHIEMGKEGSIEEFLPKRYDLTVSFIVAWNRIDGKYRAQMQYQEITPKNKRLSKKKNYNLTASYSLKCDRGISQRSLAALDSLRPIDLESYEKVIYHDYQMRMDSIQKTSDASQKKSKSWKSLDNLFFEDYQWNLQNYGTLKCTPFLNPLQLSYSKSNGLAYRQDFRYTNFLKNDKTLDFKTKLGYNFTRNEFYWNINTQFTYLPQHNGTLRFSIGNGNRIYSSDVLKDIKALTDSVFSFDLVNLEYFTDFNMSLSNEIEITNGLTATIGFNWHKRQPAKTPRLIINHAPPVINDDVIDELHKAVRPYYITFAPHIRLEWTPGLYYYMQNKKKINLSSPYPTFILDYERGIKNILKSTGVYERMELDIQHNIKIGLRSRFFYRIGAGAFTNQDETYFVDFANFQRNNLPNGWTDDIGGVFQNLDSRWYNASTSYFRIHGMLETPFLLLQYLGYATRLIRNERFYLSYLTMPDLPAHLEMGYGISNFVFDTGIFVSYNRYDKWGIGYKFSFGLFQ